MLRTTVSWLAVRPYQHQRAEHRHPRQEPKEGYARRQHADIVFRLLAPSAAQEVSHVSFGSRHGEAH